MSNVKQQTHTIEHLDFEAELPCEHSQHSTGRCGHDGYAWALILRKHTCASRPTTKKYLICRGGWEGTRTARCSPCGVRGPRDEMWQLIEVLR